MPSKYQQNQYNSIFDKLPQPIKDIIANMESAEKVYKIAQKHHLQIDQAGTLNQITIDVLMGITAAKDFIDAIKKDLQVDPSEAIGIVNDIDEAMFKPVREVMKKTFQEGAPNKLRTIATVEENDEEHLHLTKHDILREIENPPESVAKKVEEIIQKKAPIEISKTTEVEKYNEELLGNRIEIRKTETPQAAKIIMPSQTKSISEIKLSSVASIKEGENIVEKTKKEQTSRPVLDAYREPLE